MVDFRRKKEIDALMVLIEYGEVELFEGLLRSFDYEFCKSFVLVYNNHKKDILIKKYDKKQDGVSYYWMIRALSKEIMIQKMPLKERLKKKIKKMFNKIIK